MEEALEKLGNLGEKPRRNEAINILKKYVNNVVENPSNPKFRKIRISNPKFNSVIWSIEYARSFLFVAGFEENGDYLVLPEGVCLDEAKLMLDNFNLDVKQEMLPHEAQPSTSSSLKLRNSIPDNSMFDESTKADLTLLSYMKEMGFDVVVAEKALIITKNQGVQPAMDWINSNPSKVNEIRMAAFVKQSGKVETSMIQEASGNEGASEHMATETTKLPATLPAPVSRYQATIDERHKFQEKLRQEAIEAARVERINQKRQKEYLLKNLEDEKRERKEKGQWAKYMRKSEAMTSDETSAPPSTSQQQCDKILLKLRLPNGQVRTLNVEPKNQLREVYRNVTEITNLQEDVFTLVLLSSHTKLTDKDKCLEELGLMSHETLIVQRVDQIGNLTQGEGVFYQIVDIDTIEDWETFLWKNNNKLIVAQFNKIRTDECSISSKAFEDLSAKYGVHKKALFVRANTDQVQALKVNYNLTVFPTCTLFWNREVVCNVEGQDKEKLETLIKENIDSPAGRKLADDLNENFDPR